HPVMVFKVVRQVFHREVKVVQHRQQAVDGLAAQHDLPLAAVALGALAEVGKLGASTLPAIEIFGSLGPCLLKQSPEISRVGFALGLSLGLRLCLCYCLGFGLGLSFRLCLGGSLLHSCLAALLLGFRLRYSLFHVLLVSLTVEFVVGHDPPFVLAFEVFHVVDVTA